MLVEAGMPIDDAAREVENIERRMFDEANKLLEATGDVNEVGRLLRRNAVEPELPEPPPIELPEGV
jgi:hypothetical protein